MGRALDRLLGQLCFFGVAGCLAASTTALAQQQQPQQQQRPRVPAAKAQMPSPPKPAQPAPAAAPPQSGGDGLPLNDTKIIADALANPDKVINDLKFAQDVSTSYLIGLYSTIMRDYMKRHNLARPPVPFEKIKPYIDSIRLIPHPILLEMLQARTGSSVLIGVISSELIKYEAEKGLPPSIPTAPPGTGATGLPPAAEVGMKQLQDQLTVLQGRVDAFEGGNRVREMVMAGLVAVSLLLSIWSVARR